MDNNYELLIQYKETGDKKIRDEIVLNNMSLIHYVYNRFFSGYIVDPHTKQDIIQSGVLGLMTAIESFDINAYNVLSTYAVSYIRNRMSRSISRDIPFTEFENEESEIAMEDQIQGDYGIDEERYSTYEFLSTICTSNELSVIELLNRTCNEPYWSINSIAKKLHMTADEVRDAYESGMQYLSKPWVQWYLYKVKGVYN